MNVRGGRGPRDPMAGPDARIRTAEERLPADRAATAAGPATSAGSRATATVAEGSSA